MESIFDKKVVFWVFIFLILFQKVNAQNNLISTQTWVDLGVVNQGKLALDFLTSEGEDSTTVFVMELSGNENDSALLYKINYKSNEVEKFKIKKFPKIKNSIYDFKVFHESIYLMFNQFIGIFRFNKELGFYEYYKGVDLEYTYQKIFALTDSTLLFSCTYNFHPEDQAHPVVFSIFNTNNNKVTKSIFPKLEGIELSYFPNRWVSANFNKGFSVIEPTTLKILNFDVSLSNEKTILFPEKIQNNSIECDNDFDPEMIEQIRAQDDKLLRAESFFQINDSAYLIILKYPNCKFNRKVILGFTDSNWQFQILKTDILFNNLDYWEGKKFDVNYESSYHREFLYSRPAIVYHYNQFISFTPFYSPNYTSNKFNMKNYVKSNEEFHNQQKGYTFGLKVLDINY